MGAKLDRLGAELAKARKKKAEWDAKVKDSVLLDMLWKWHLVLKLLLK